MLTKVQIFALEAHDGQRYGDHPYIDHLADVVRVLRRFGFFDDDLMTAAWLHDSVEDAGVLLADIATQFGDDVAALVYAVTDGEGKNRRERKTESYRKMAERPRAIILKLADRIANVESSIQNNGGLLQMYRKEHSMFVEKLQALSPPESRDMWEYLAKLLEQPST